MTVKTKKLITVKMEKLAVCIFSLVMTICHVVTFNSGSSLFVYNAWPLLVLVIILYYAFRIKEREDELSRRNEYRADSLVLNMAWIGLALVGFLITQSNSLYITADLMKESIMIALWGIMFLRNAAFLLYERFGTT